MSTNRVVLTAVSIMGGIITLIEENGEIGFYRQRGIGTIPDEIKMQLVRTNQLDARWQSVTELPKNYSIEYEDEDIMGKARATFSYKRG